MKNFTKIILILSLMPFLTLAQNNYDPNYISTGSTDWGSGVSGGTFSPGSGVTGGIFSPGSGVTGGPQIPGIFNPLAGKANTLGELVIYIISKVRILAVSFAALMLVIGAYQILFAAGDPKKFQTGKNTIIYAIVGLGIVLLAQTLVGIIESIVS